MSAEYDTRENWSYDRPALVCLHIARAHGVAPPAHRVWLEACDMASNEGIVGMR